MIVEKIDATHVPVFSRRSLIMVAVVVGIVTGANLWLNRNASPLGYVEFSNFGFSISHPQDMRIQILAFNDAYPSSESGQLQGSRQGAGVEQFGVFWDTVDESTDLVSILDMTFEMAAEENVEGFIHYRGPYETIMKDGHEVTYQDFEIKENDVVIPAVIGIWRCDTNSKIYILYYVELPDFSRPEIRPDDLAYHWRTYLNSLECH